MKLIALHKIKNTTLRRLVIVLATPIMMALNILVMFPLTIVLAIIIGLNEKLFSGAAHYWSSSDKWDGNSIFDNPYDK